MDQVSRPRHPTAFDPGATTHTARGARPRAARIDHLLAAGDVITSPDTHLAYRVGAFLGQGGFGQVFMATRVGPSRSVPDEVCIKISTHMDGWLRRII